MRQLWSNGHLGVNESCLNLRYWEHEFRVGGEVEQIKLGEKSATDLSVHSNRSVCTMSFSNNVAFYDPVTMHKLKEFQAPTQINSAHLHPHQKYFVCGGHDFKIYKCDYETGKEVDSYKG